MFLRLGSTSL